nr:hypothetical protein [uncultured Sulfurimonas sp.]
MSKLIRVTLFVLIISLGNCVANNRQTTGLEGKEVSAYLVGKYVDVSSAKTKLKEAGFEVLATYSPVKKGTTIIFTNEALKAEGAKTGRAYAAILRLFIDDKEKTISFTNPIYFAKAYMQSEYKHSVFKTQLDAINKEFSDLSASADKMMFDNLQDYHFMVGMPYYADVDVLAKGTKEELLSKARNYKKGKFMIFELKLSDSSTLVGYDLGKRTKKFVKKIGRANAAILPYCISIENEKASSLEAKYYIALSYPLLSMNEFTKIATVPGAITKDLEKIFK